MMRQAVLETGREHMLKMNQVIQIGEIEGNIHYYIEDYAYTFLKKQEGKERKKYFLYGEKEETKEKTKLYIYGIGQKPKMEQTYFKEYYPLGFLKIKEEGNYWISLNGQENEIKGIYVFYAPNQAMQEYLVDYHKEEIKEEVTEKEKKRTPVQIPPMKEATVSAKRWRKKSSKEDKLLYSAGAVFIALLLTITLTTSNGRNKIEIFKQVIQETMSNTFHTTAEELVIEERTMEHINTEIVDESRMPEKNIENNYEIKEMEVKETDIIETDEITEVQNTVENNNTENTEAKLGELDTNSGIEAGENGEETKTDTETKEEVGNGEDVMKEQTQYEEYIVQNGDTLVGICKKRYNSLLKMDEICNLNKIKDADYIAPGQKLYLP